MTSSGFNLMTFRLAAHYLNQQLYCHENCCPLGCQPAVLAIEVTNYDMDGQSAIPSRKVRDATFFDTVPGTTEAQPPYHYK